MYLCVCNAISDRQVKQALAEGLASVRELRRHFDYPERSCGKCHGCLREMINAQHSKPNPG
ncbi:MAG: (2Fe-2S)-binding protein [Gammaproteobacteria bacterium]